MSPYRCERWLLQNGVMYFHRFLFTTIYILISFYLSFQQLSKQNQRPCFNFQRFGFYVLTEVTMKIMSLWGYDTAGVLLLLTARFLLISCLPYSSTLKKEATHSYETSMDSCRTTMRYNPEVRTLSNDSFVQNFCGIFVSVIMMLRNCQEDGLTHQK
jgi:hypothetical protein